MINFKVFGRPGVKVRSVAAWDRLSAITYDARILLTSGLAHYWPLDEKVLGPDYVYDDIILQTAGLGHYWPLDGLQEIIYSNYDSLVLFYAPDDYWPMDEKETY